MKKNIMLLTSDRKEWDRLLARFEQGKDEVYFQQSYLSLQHDSGEPQAFVYENNGQVFFVPYLKRQVPYQFNGKSCFDLESPYGYSGVLSTSDDVSFLQNAWSAFYKQCRDGGIIAGFLRFHPFLKNHLFAVNAGVESIAFSNKVVTIRLDKTLDEVLAGYSQNARNKVSKSKKSGVSVRSSNELADLKIFQKLYYQTLDQLNASETYYFDDRYFEGLHERLRGHYRVFLASSEGTDIGGVLVFLSPRYVYFHLSANLKEYRFAEPASLLRHEVISAYLNSGKEEILFGGGKTSDPKDSLYVFKKGFSKEEDDFYFGKLIFDEAAFQAVCNEWEQKNPDKKEKAKNFFLKYKL